MNEPNTSVIRQAEDLRNRLASDRLSPVIAKLYSQHTRLSTGQRGLGSWSADEASARFDDAVKLIEASLILLPRTEGESLKGLRRAAEIMEWLSHPSVLPDNAPSRLMAAALYQIAGYPARAAGLLKEPAIGAYEWSVLSAFLKADFLSVQRLLIEYWNSEQPYLEPDTVADEDSVQARERLQHWLLQQICSSLGLVNSAMRWGDTDRLRAALDKLENLGKLFLHADDRYSWLLGLLTYRAAERLVSTSLRSATVTLVDGLSTQGVQALEKYARQNFQSNRVLVWPSQMRGIQALRQRDSFALCTPTGSGKTMVAELAIIQSLFQEVAQDDIFAADPPAPLALYVVPSRALASEVESKLSRVLRDLTSDRIIVTGLYGGTDWGPTDAWATADEKTVLICTFEKAEALMRFLGPIFLNRVSLIVIDEAHGVEFAGSEASLVTSEHRSLRLESLAMRLFAHRDRNTSRIIALSAVAAGAERALASWVSEGTTDTAETSDYRSTRQIIGRLECRTGRSMEIRYDVLDGASLAFEDGGTRETPFIPSPFPPHPPASWIEGKGPEKALRPYLFWSAMHLAARGEGGRQQSVLVMVPQRIYGYAQDLLRLLESSWALYAPSIFSPPEEPGKHDLWQKCLNSCIDYFGSDSLEYRLLLRGVVLHHGKMPGLLARLLIQSIDQRIFHLVIATSTLSEGINLPFETVLIPTLRRAQSDLSVSEFKNLVGRAGRPGTGTEGRTLVLLGSPELVTKPADKRSISNARNRYHTLIGGLVQTATELTRSVKSPLAELIKYLEMSWRAVYGVRPRSEFLDWLEVTEPLVQADQSSRVNENPISALDSLDNILLSGIVESEQMAGMELSDTDIEAELLYLWQHSFAHYAAAEEARLKESYCRRGRAISNRVYPSRAQRQRFYRTGLPPRAAHTLIAAYPTIKAHLAKGGDYAIRQNSQRVEYIVETVSLLNSLEQFKMRDPSDEAIAWEDILRWWLDPDSARVRPEVTEISAWLDYVSQNFVYRFNWGLGSIIALAADEAFGLDARSLTLKDWEGLGLPWSAFWLKELITWGTLDPVAAYLLSKGMRFTRGAASEAAAAYYQDRADSPNDRLNPSAIRSWAELHIERREDPVVVELPSRISVTLLRDFGSRGRESWKVLPVERLTEITWIDPAGFALASCPRIDTWQASYSERVDFQLSPSERSITWELYF